VEKSGETERERERELDIWTDRRIDRRRETEGEQMERQRANEMNKKQAG